MDWTRRSLLGGMAASLLAGRASAVSERLPLWPGLPPGGGGPAVPEHISTRGALSDIGVPHLRPYLTAKPTGAAMLVAGGGGYRHIEMATEAHPAALWLAAQGITAFELVYRLPGEGWAAGPLAPLQDAQRAIRLIRANAQHFALDSKRIGVLGFSAGAHLLGLAATRPDFQSYAAVDTADALSARPDTAALIYPIITLLPPYDDTSTRRYLLGEHPSPATLRAWSVQTYVTPRCPPVFLVQAADDTVASPANSRIMQQACAKAGVPVALHLLTSGGHGFGMGAAGSETGRWPGWYAAWLRGRGVL